MLQIKKYVGMKDMRYSRELRRSKKRNTQSLKRGEGGIQQFRTSQTKKNKANIKVYRGGGCVLGTVYSSYDYDQKGEKSP